MNGFQLVRGPWQPPPRQDGLGPRDHKTNQENDLQVAELSYRPDPTRLGPELDAAVEASALDRILAEGYVRAVVAKVPEPVRGFPCLVVDRADVDLRCVAERLELGGRLGLASAIREQIRTRASSAWPNADDVARSRRYLGEARLPPPPEPELPSPTPAYVEAAKLVIAGCRAEGIVLSTLDPRYPERGLTKHVQGGVGDAFAAVASMIERGYTLGWQPHGRRMLPPRIEISGFGWRELEDGSGVVLAATEPEAKPSKSKGGAK